MMLAISMPVAKKLGVFSNFQNSHTSLLSLTSPRTKPTNMIKTLSLLTHHALITHNTHLATYLLPKFSHMV